MDKVNDLKKRVEKLEKQINKTWMDEVKIGTAFLQIISPESEKRVDVLEKYSKPNISEKYEEFDLRKAIEVAKSMSDASLKLKFWTDYFLRIYFKLENKDDWYEYQFLYVFSLRAKEYYERKIIERLLKEGDYYKGRGNKAHWDPEKSVKWWFELIRDDAFLKDNKKPFKTKIYDEIRRRHNPKVSFENDEVPALPTEKTIRNHLQEAGVIKKRK